MKISIITVCYNEAETIEKTLLSIFSQTYKNIELIIIDGGSTDGTLDVIEKYRDKIAYFVSEPDEGVYNAMNKGIKAATGDILYFLNANDTLYSYDIFETVVNTFRKGDYDFVYGDVRLVYPDKEETMRFNKGINYHRILSHQICHQVIFYKKSLFDEFGFYNENYSISADHEFNMRIWANKKIKPFYLDKIVANFDRTGISTNKKFEKIRENENSLIFYKYAFSTPFSRAIYYIKWLLIDPLIFFKPKKLLQLCCVNKLKKQKTIK